MRMKWRRKMTQDQQGDLTEENTGANAWRNRFNRNREVARYRFGKFISKGGKSIFTSLIALFFICFIIALMVRGIIMLLFPEDDITGICEQAWIIFLEMTDPGSMGMDHDNPAAFRFSAVVAGILGVIIFSMLIAFITTQLETMLDELKKGHSKVIESDHTLILGWNERVMNILRELIICNESRKSAKVVILAEMDKVAMDDEIKNTLEDLKTTEIITRSGQPTSIQNLMKVSADKARSAIILGTCSQGDKEEQKLLSDAAVSKTILALRECRKDITSINIVAELMLQGTLRLFQRDKTSRIPSVDSSDILGQILVLTSRTSGLSWVYEEILSFEGNEFYFFNGNWGDAGFYDIAYNFPDGIPIGIRRNDGTIIIKPKKDERLGPKDEVLILAQDDSTISYTNTPFVSARELSFPIKKVEKQIEKELIMGWHPMAPMVLKMYASYLIDGSTVDIMIQRPSADFKQTVERYKEQYPSLNINLIAKNPLSMDSLASVHPFEYNNVIILSQGEKKGTPERLDSETLFILLLLRQIQQDLKIKDRKTKLITQVMNSENTDLIDQSNVDDYLISNRIITRILTQLSEEPDLKKVYDHIFAKTGCELFLKPASLYFEDLPLKVRFADIMSNTFKRNEICLGYRSGDCSTDSCKNFGITLNPKKDLEFTLTAEDTLVVLAEDEL